MMVRAALAVLALLTPSILVRRVMVEQILITQRDPKHPLADQRRHLVLHQLRRTMVRKQPANRSINAIARPVAPTSFRSDLSTSKAATTARPSNVQN